MSGYDVFGNIVVVKFKRNEREREKRAFAKKFLAEHRSVRTVLEKIGKFSGRLRIQKTKFILGEKTKEALYRENGCEFRLNIDTCYFSGRLASERKELAEEVKRERMYLFYVVELLLMQLLLLN